MSAAACAGVFLIACRMLGGRAGITAGAIAVVYPFHIFFSGLILGEAAFTFLLVLLLYILDRLYVRRSVRLALAAGAVPVAPSRPSAAYIPGEVCPWLVTMRSRSPQRGLAGSSFEK